MNPQFNAVVLHFGVKNYTSQFHASKNKTGPCFTLHAYSGQGVCFRFFAGKQLENTNESFRAWPWNCAWLMLTLETQLNSSVLNQNGALWLGDWDPRSPQARLTASCCSALDLWQQTKVLFLFCSAFINPQISPPPTAEAYVFFVGVILNACTPQAPVKYFSKSVSTSSGEDATTCWCL